MDNCNPCVIDNKFVKATGLAQGRAKASSMDPIVQLGQLKGRGNTRIPRIGGRPLGKNIK